MHVLNLGFSSLPKKWGPETFTLAHFSTTLRLKGEYFFERDIYNRARGFGNYTLCPTSSQIFINFDPQTGQKRLKTEAEVLPTLRKLCILLYCQRRTRRSANGTQTSPKEKGTNGADVSRRISNVNETIEIRWLVSRAQNI